MDCLPKTLYWKWLERKYFRQSTGKEGKFYYERVRLKDTANRKSEIQVENS